MCFTVQYIPMKGYTDTAVRHSMNLTSAITNQ